MMPGDNITRHPGGQQALGVTADPSAEAPKELHLTLDHPLNQLCDGQTQRPVSIVSFVDSSPDLPQPQFLEDTGPAPAQSSLPQNINTNEGQLTHATENLQARQITDTELPAPSSGLRLPGFNILTPDTPLGSAPKLRESLKAIFFSSWLNVLLVLIPVAWTVHFASPHESTLIFVFSFLSIIPLSHLLAFATDELSLRVGQTLAGLLNVTFGNAVELIIAIVALLKCQLHVVQSSLVGSILGDLLLVLGICFLAGGMRYSEQGFSVCTTHLSSSLLTISVIAILSPTAYVFSASGLSDQKDEIEIAKVSHGAAIILFSIYVAFLVFQFYSHTALYHDTGEHIIKSTKYAPRASSRKSASSSHVLTRTNTTISARPNDDEAVAGTGVNVEGPSQLETDAQQPKLSAWVAAATLLVVTTLVAITAEWLVESIDGLTATGKVSTEFVGVILLPTVGNAPDLLSAPAFSVKDKLILSFAVAVGSTIQTALFLIPFMVILGWILDKPLTLWFDPYESVAVFFAVLTVNYVVQDGKSNWMEGFVLISLYVLIALTFFFYPGSNVDLSTCT